MNDPAPDVDTYLAGLPENVRTTLEAVRRMVRDAAPDAVESISYGMPTYKHRGKPLIYFGAAKKHCALYGTSAGTVHFPFGEPPPEATVRAFVDERRAAIEAKAAPGSKRKPKD